MSGSTSKASSVTRSAAALSERFAGVAYGEERKLRPSLESRIYIASRQYHQLVDTNGGLIFGWRHEGGAVIGRGDDGSTLLGMASPSEPTLDPVPKGVWIVLGENPRGLLGDGVRWREVPLSVVDTDAENFARSAGLSRLDVLAAKRVVVIGCGSVGAAITDALGHQGIGEFVLIDPDVFGPHNIGRHQLDWSAVGSSKVNALAERLRRINPSVRVVSHFADALAEETQLEAIVRDADLVVSAPDSRRVRSVVNHICVALGTPLVSCAFYEHAVASEIIFVWPDQTPCLRCIHEYDAGVRIQSDVPYAGKNTQPGEPGLSLDIALGVDISSSIALATLDPSGRRFEGLHPGYNWIRAHSGQLPADEWREHFHQPFEVIWYHAEKNPECEHCGPTPDAERTRQTIRQRAGIES